VFGVMFYSIIKHRKSQRRTSRRTSTRATTVEIIWTVVPFIIVIMLGACRRRKRRGRDEGHERRRSHDQGHRRTSGNGGYDYLKGEGEGISMRLHPRCFAARDVQLRAHLEGDNYLLKVDNPLVVPVDKQDPHHHHRQRRDPLLHGAGLWRQAGRDPRLCARHLVPRGEGGRLLRSMR
jgi:cytochrome c oxidase subunit 2